jgi:uncharacterized damage-inducible protein DinB
MESNILINCLSKILIEMKNYLISLPSEIYSTDSISIPSSTIGKQVRHILDHINKIVFYTENEMVEYDKRERNVPMEINSNCAIEYIEKILSNLNNSFKNVDFSEKMKLKVTVNESNEEMTVESTVGREIWFICHHAIHHLAIIGVLSLELGFTPPKGFGIAPSTAVFLNNFPSKSAINI